MSETMKVRIVETVYTLSGDLFVHAVVVNMVSRGVTWCHMVSNARLAIVV